MTKTARQLQEEGLLYDVFEKELTDIKDRTYGLVSELSRASHFDMEYVVFTNHFLKVVFIELMM